MPKVGPPPATDWRQCDVINAVVDNGWLGVLSKVDLDVFLCYLRHANFETGIAFPGAKTIADKLGHRQARHVRASRRRLLKLGLLVEEEPGGGRKRKTVRVVIPLTQARIRPTPNRASQGGRKRGRLGAPNPAYQPAPNPGTELHTELPKEKTNINNTAADVVGFLSEEEERTKEAREALRAEGIMEPTRGRLLKEIPGLTADAVLEIARGMDGTAGTGLLIEAIRADGLDKVEELAVRQRRIDSIEAGNRERAVERAAWVKELITKYNSDLPRHTAIADAIVQWRIANGTARASAEAHGDAALRYMVEQKMLSPAEMSQTGTAVIAETPMEARKMMAILRGRKVAPNLIDPIDDKFGPFRQDN